MAVEKPQRGTINTTIRKDVLDDFRDYCNGLGIPMNVILEAFMRQFAQGDFVLKMGNSGTNMYVED